MIPILTCAAMREADARAVAQRGSDVLVEAAGVAVGLEAKRLLRSCYGARVAILVGPGLNGGDGRLASRWLKSRGAHVDLVEWDHAPAILRGHDLVIDAAFGTGCSRPFVAPKVSPGTIVLAVDLPSGVDTDTGAVLGKPMIADVTLALGAIKPAHLDGLSTEFVGEIRFAGLDIVNTFDDGLVDDHDLDAFIHLGAHDHKWVHAVQAFAGSTLMPGAAELVLRGALAGGASMIRLASRGDVSELVTLPPEVVHVSELGVDPRCRAVVAGPGLGPDAWTWLRERMALVTVPVVLDADGLDRTSIDELAPRNDSWILTPHEGEFTRLTGHPLGPSRFDAVRELARATQCVVLLKGPTTVIANAAGALRVVNSGTPALATAGSGDVLSGLMVGTVARGHDPFEAAALSAHLHGRAGARLRPYAPASELVAKVREILSELECGTR
jgi:NAD(P)H-hydrate epimerase